MENRKQNKASSQNRI